MTYFYILAIVSALIALWSAVGALHLVATNLGVIATCNVFWMHYHGDDDAIRQAGAIIARKVGAVGDDSELSAP